MKRYITVDFGSIFSGRIGDRMAETPADAVMAHYEDVGRGPCDCIEHTPADGHKLRRYANLFDVYEVPGEALGGDIGQDERTLQLIESLFKPVAIVECIERPHRD